MRGSKVGRSTGVHYDGKYTLNRSRRRCRRTFDRIYLYNQVTKVKIDNEVVADITDEIQKGAMAFLFAEYRILTIFVVVVGAVLAYLNDVDTAIAFFAGAIASVLAGFSGMRSATSANGRTAMAAKNDGQAGALAVSTTVAPSWDCPLAVSACLVSRSSLIGLVLRMETHSQQQLDSVWVLRPSHCSPVLVVEFTPRLRTLVLTCR